MAIKPIRIYGEPCLHRASEAVERFDSDLDRLIADMADTMYAAEATGVGLAAPQIGVNLRIFVMDVDWVEENGRRSLQVFINPEVVDESVEDRVSPEGCLSLPGIEGEVYRPVGATLRYLDRNGVQRETEFRGFAARCTLHEYDHLDGVLFVDRMAPAKRRKLAGKLAALRDGAIAGRTS